MRGNVGSTRQAIRSRENSARNAEIGEIPGVVDPERRASCAGNFELFCTTYFPDLFYLKFGEVHKAVIHDIEETVRCGKLKAIALPRSSGKTTLCQCAVLWSLLYGYRKFAVLVTAETTRANQLLADVRIWLETNELLLEDFPEVCYPFHCLDGISQRSRAQTYRGERTRIDITAGKLTLPTIEGSVSSGARLVACGITSNAIRGLAATTADGKKIRPDVVLVDDPSTAESARSYEQNNTRERLVKADLLGMAGAGKKIAMLVTCTVIAEDDLALRLLDHKRNVEFNGTRIQLMPSLPANTELWNHYRNIRADNQEAATEYYRMNQAAMDAGAVVTWKDRYNEDEISAIQNAMNLKFRDESAFLSEYQQMPSEKDDEVFRISPAMISSRANHLDSFEIENDKTFATAFIDCHADLLYWLVVAWDMRMNAQIVSFGGYPEQKNVLFERRNAHPTLERTDAGYQKGVIDCIEHVMNLPLTVPIHRIGVDVGYQQSLVHDALANSQYRKQVVGQKGLAYGARANRTIADYKPSKTRRVGNHWFIDLPDGRNQRILMSGIDTYFWKSRVYDAFQSGTITINGGKAEFAMLAQHCTERGILETAGSTSVVVWTQSPSLENHLFDALVGNYAVANQLGSSFMNQQEDRPRRRRSLYREALKQ